MKILVILLAFSTLFVEHLTKDLSCKNGGCYEAIKTLAEMLENKITETDAILAEAERELNEVTFGNNDDFQEKLKEVDKKLSNLIVEFYVGVDGGDKSLIELINSVFEDVKNLENLTDDVGTETETAAKNADAIDKNVDSTKETIRELQAELSRLMNSTSEDAPQALQDAFDRSEKFNTNSSQLKEILDQVKRILKDYEINLLNSKLLTSQAIEKFAGVAKKQESTAKEQAVVDEQLSGVDNMKTSENLMKNMKKLAGEALEQSNKVFEEAFDLLNEVSEFELHDKLKEINDKVEELNKHSEATGVNVKQFADDNAKFLDKVEATIDAAEIAEVKALKLQKEIEELLIMVNGIHVDAIKAIADKDTIIENAKNIYNNLQDFTLKVEKSRENARMALEKIPEILKKINDSVDIVEKLEDKLDASTKAAIKAQEMCTTAKQQMDEILGESDEIRARIEKLGKDFESLPSNNEDADKEGTRISDEIDKLEKIEAVDSPLIEAAKIKIDKTKTQSQSTDVAIDVALKNIEELMDQLGKLKNIDHDVLNDFEAILNEAEKELDVSGLNHNLKHEKAKRHQQLELTERYRLELSALEYQLSVIKMNAESLENRCFKRTRLEP